jgi:hypothetical protein
MDIDPKARSVIERYDELKSERGVYEKTWQDIRELVRPGTTDFNKQTTPGNTRTECIYDGTAPEALEELASGLHSYLTNPSDRWFDIEVQDMREVESDDDALLWLEQVSDIIYNEYSNEQTGFNTSLHEGYMDIGAFGTEVVNQEFDKASGHLSFRTHPLASAYISESHLGRVDTMYRCLSMTKRQMIQEFGEAALPEKIRQNEDRTKKYEIIHAVYPRTDRDKGKYDQANMRFASCWVCKDFGYTLRESGYNSFPYHVPRWNKLADETYGRGPAITCLPDIRMLNRIEFTTIKAATKACDPPLIVPNDGFMLPIRTSPGAIIFKEPGAEEVQTLEHKGNFPITFEMAEQKRAFIRKCFYAEWLRLEKKKERQTAFEIQEMIEEQLRMLAPMIGRVTAELLGPMLERSYELLNAVGRFPQAPPSLQKQRLKVVYKSTAAIAQKGVRATTNSRWLQEILPVTQVDPSILDHIDLGEYVKDSALARNVGRRIMRSSEKVAELRAQRDQQQQMAQMAEIAEPASKAALNVAQANALGGTA